MKIFFAFDSGISWSIFTQYNRESPGSLRACAGAYCSCQSNSDPSVRSNSTLKLPSHPQEVNSKWIVLLQSIDYSGCTLHSSLRATRHLASYLFGNCPDPQISCEGAICSLCPKCGAAWGWFGPGIGVPGCPCLLLAAVNGTRTHLSPYGTWEWEDESGHGDSGDVTARCGRAVEVGTGQGQRAQGDWSSAASVTRHPFLHPLTQFCLQISGTAGRNSVYYGSHWSFHQQGNMLASLF